MKKYLFLILTFLLLIPINVLAGTCDPNSISICSITLENTTGSASEKEEASIDGNNIDINLHMESVGDSAEYGIELKNESDADYELDESSFKLNSDYIECTITSEDNSNIVPANSTKEFTIRLTYKEEVPLESLTTGKYTDSNRMDINITSDASNSDPIVTPTPGITSTPVPTMTPKSEESPIHVPNTFAKSSTVITVLIVVIFGVTAYYYRKNKYVVLTILVLGTVLIVSTKRSFALCSTSLSIESDIEIETKIAIFLPGNRVNEKMKQLADNNPNYLSYNSTITRIERFMSTPDTNNLVEDNIVSIDGCIYPIYMWYDSTNTTIYWYTEAESVYYNSDASYMFYRLLKIDNIQNLSDVSSKNVTNMSHMFDSTGYNSTEFTLNLGDKFDTSNVTTMSNMFNSTGHHSSVFTLDLGDKFDTSNVVDMQWLFYFTGYSSTVFTLDLGDKFDTSNVTNMNALFSSTGYSSTVFTLDLGEKFDTSNATNMSGMFSNIGYNNPSFILDLGDKFDTSNVTTMSNMFSRVGYINPSFTLDLGDKFDTSNVTDMGAMFASTGYCSTIFTLDLGNKFDTSNVTNMASMFGSTGYKSTIFTLNLGDKFDTSKVTNMQDMFWKVGYNNTSFTLDLGDKFNTGNVTNMYSMFDSTGYTNTSFTLDLGDKFDTSKVINMYQMFRNFKGSTIYATSAFVTTSVNNSEDMFKGCTNLVGGEGTTFVSAIRNASRAHIDGGTSNPGYFTDRSVLNR